MSENTSNCLTVSGQQDLVAQAERVFDLVWRVDFTTPGFCLLDTSAGVQSHTLQAWMVDLKERSEHIAARRGMGLFVYRSMARFDQQETTKFHIDGAPDQSLLMLGYEPSLVRSRMFLADYSRGLDLGITPQQFLQDFNPMYRRGEELLARYTTELPQLQGGQSRLLLINNSSLPYSDQRRNSLGVMHKAEIINPTDSERRIVNSTMLVLGEQDEIGQDQQQEFVTTDKISQKLY